jgi:hypothetical protein
MSERKPPSLAFTAFERALLRSADADEAPHGAAGRALLALGVGTSHAAVSQSASGAAVQTPGAAWTLWQKPLLIGVLARQRDRAPRNVHAVPHCPAAVANSTSPGSSFPRGNAGAQGSSRKNGSDRSARSDSGSRRA